MGLVDKTLTEIRELAQSLGVQDIFGKTRKKLEQEINNKQLPEPVQSEPVQIDIIAAQELPVDDVLKPFIARGLHYMVQENRWYMAHGARTDEGSIDMPIAHIVRCAEKIMA